MRNQTPRPISSHGQPWAIRSPGPVDSWPVVLRNSTTPTPIQTIGHVRFQKVQPPRRSSSVVMNVATPTRMMKSGHASVQDRSITWRTRKTTPSPISHVPPTSAPRLARITAPSWAVVAACPPAPCPPGAARLALTAVALTAAAMGARRASAHDPVPRR